MIKKEASKFLRGIAAIMVVASHYAEWIGVSDYEPLREFIMRLGDFGVDIFFALSAYGLVKAAKKTGITLSFILKRIVSVYLPYLLVLSGLDIINGTFLSPEKNWYNFLTGFDFWFMRNLFVFYLMFFVFWKWGKTKCLLLYAGVLIYSYHLFTQERLEFWYVSNIAFVIGAFYGEKEEFFKKVYREFWGKTVGLILMIGSLYFANRTFTLPEETDTLVWLHFVFTIGLLLLGSGKWFKTYLLSLLGAYSLYFYLLHARLFHAMYWQWDHLTGFRRWGLVFIISVFVSLLVGFFCQDILIRGGERLLKKRKTKEE